MRRRRRMLSIGSIVLFGVGGYLLLLVLSPRVIVPIPAGTNASIQSDEEEAPKADSILIPKIGVDIEYRSGGSEVLNDFAWHRYPERGNPVDGGNMIISAHRFSLAPTPAETRRRSPFYNIHHLVVGDEITIRYKEELYHYRVHELKRVTPISIDIEAPSSEPILTIYSCTLGGERDGREVVIAHPVQSEAVSQ